MSGPKFVYTHSSFRGHWPVGTAAVVIADSQEMAAALLMDELERRGLKQHVWPTDMRMVNRNECAAYILCDGDY